MVSLDQEIIPKEMPSLRNCEYVYISRVNNLFICVPESQSVDTVYIQLSVMLSLLKNYIVTQSQGYHKQVSKMV